VTNTHQSPNAPLGLGSLDDCPRDVDAIEPRDIHPDAGTPCFEPIIRRTSLTVSDFVTGDANGHAQAVQKVFSILRTR